MSEPADLYYVAGGFERSIDDFLRWVAVEMHIAGHPVTTVWLSPNAWRSWRRELRHERPNEIRTPEGVCPVRVAVEITRMRQAPHVSRADRFDRFDRFDQIEAAVAVAEMTRREDALDPRHEHRSTVDEIDDSSCAMLAEGKLAWLDLRGLIS